MNLPKKIAAIHDISGLGRSSLATAMPILSVMGHQVCPVPTAVLSTITGFYENYVLHDLTDIMPGYLGHWKQEGEGFDCVYTGFLASKRQSDIAADFITYAKPSLTVVDPVFADNGEIYSCFGEDMVAAMRQFIKKADIITPNITEAAYLLSAPLVLDSVDAAREYAKRLSDGGSVVITGVRSNKKAIAVIAYDRETDRIYKIENEYLETHFPGTGDIFASVLTGALLCDFSLEKGCERAAQFVCKSIKAGVEGKAPRREGVPFEPLLPTLLEGV